MNNAATLHRFIYLFRRLRAPYTYPSKQQMIAELRDKGFHTSLRTLERDIQAFKEEYGLIIGYNRSKGGYYFALPEDEDVAHFETFLELLERRERLAFLSESSALFQASRYLVLERNPWAKGRDWLPLLWEALQSKRIVQFGDTPYDQPKPQTRLVAPALIVEDRNRWYLIGQDQEKKQMRFFGLDRIEGLSLTDKLFKDSVREDYRNRKQQAIGMTCLEEAAQRVLLRIEAKEAPYVLSLPWHESQRVVKQTEAYTDIALTVVVNYELEREILGKGEAIEVLEPVSLRETIVKRLKAASQKYEAQ